jgi:hypothetical protein
MPSAHSAWNQATSEKNTPNATYSRKCSPITAKWMPAVASDVTARAKYTAGIGPRDARPR